METHTPVKGYKVFDSDWTCNPNGHKMRYEVGKTYEEDLTPKVCTLGFHFCENAADCFNFYRFDPSNKVAEVLALGEIDTDGVKSCTNKIKIVREIPWTELLDLVNIGKGCTGLGNSGNFNSGDRNSGDRNSGDWNSSDWNSGSFNSGNRNSGNRNSGNRNSGDRNSGNRNSGDWNSGDWNSGSLNSGNRNSGDWNSGDWNSGSLNSGSFNSGNRNSGNFNSGDWNSGDWNSGSLNSGNRNSGDWNSGDWNSGNFNSGCFNTVEQKIYLFNRPSEWRYIDWLRSDARRLLDGMPGERLVYVCLDVMTEAEKSAHPEAEVTGGYLRKEDMRSARTDWWRGLSREEKAIIMAIPNFDREIFLEITGIDVGENP